MPGLLRDSFAAVSKDCKNVSCTPQITPCGFSGMHNQTLSVGAMCVWQSRLFAR